MKKMIAFALAACLLLSAAARAAEPEVMLKIGHDQALNTAFDFMANLLAEKIAAKTDGKVAVEVYPMAQLGDEKTMLESMSYGTLDFVISATANASVYVPELSTLTIAYLFENAEKFKKTIMNEELNTYYQDLVKEKDIGFKLLHFAGCYARQLYTTFPVRSPGDLKGRKIRVMAAPTESKTWGSFGALPVTISFGEVYTGLQTDLIEGAENSPNSIFTAKHYEVAKYVNLTSHQWGVIPLWVADSTLEKLTPGQVDAVYQAALEVAEISVDNDVRLNEESLKDMEAAGAVIIRDVDIPAFMKVVAPLQDEIAAEFEGTEVLKMVREITK